MPVFIGRNVADNRDRSCVTELQHASVELSVMLKWTLRTPGDNISCPPSPQFTSSPVGKSKLRIKSNLKDSNKCWYESQVKIAEVKSTSKVVQFSSKENVRYIEKYTKESYRDNLFKPKSSLCCADSSGKRKKKSNREIKCNAFDPLRLFSGDITDSDTGSVYMKLEKTPAALISHDLHRNARIDPRRRPLVDVSNGDYCDLRKHLQQLYEISDQGHIFPEAVTTKDNQFQQPCYQAELVPAPHPRKESLLSSQDQTVNMKWKMVNSNKSCHSNNRQQLSVGQTGMTTSVTTTSPQKTLTTVYSTCCTAKCQTKEEVPKRNTQRSSRFSWKRHSIADIPSAFRRFEMARDKTVPGKIKDNPDPEKKDDTNVTKQQKTKKEKKNMCRKLFEVKSKKKNANQEPIYEQLGSPSPNLHFLDDKEAYLVMNDYIEPAEENGSKDDDYEICSYSSQLSPLKYVSSTKNDNHVYANQLNARLENQNNINASLSETLVNEGIYLNFTRDFTSSPQKNIHKPVPIKVPGCEKELRTHYENVEYFIQPVVPSSCKSIISDKRARSHCRTGQHIHAPYSTNNQHILNNLRPPINCNTTKSCEIVTVPCTDKTSVKRDIKPLYGKPDSSSKCYIEKEFTGKIYDNTSSCGSSSGCHSNQSIENLDSGMSEGVTTPLVSPIILPERSQSPHSDSLLDESSTPLSIDDIPYCKYSTDVTYFPSSPGNLCSTLNSSTFNKFKNMFLYPCDDLEETILSRISEEQSIISNNNDLHSSISAKNNSITKNAEISALVASTVGRNLFALATPQKGHSYDRNGETVNRRHSICSVHDYSTNSAKLSFVDDTSIWHYTQELGEIHNKKSVSLTSFSPVADLNPTQMIDVCDKGCINSYARTNSLVEKGNFNGGPIKVPETDYSQQKATALETKGAGNKTKEGRENNAQSGENIERRDIASSKTIHHSIANSTHDRSIDVHVESSVVGKSKNFPIPSTTVPSFRGYPISLLPGEVIEKISDGSFPQNVLFPVPILHHSGDGSIRQNGSSNIRDANEVLNFYNESESNIRGQFSDTQRLRNRESSYRVQTLLNSDLCNDSFSDNSADWSVEAILDNSSLRDFDDSDIDDIHICDSQKSPQSIYSSDNTDNFSVCTLDSELADNLILGPKLCDKIKQISEEKMFAKFRKSFRKKDKPTPRVGIFMFVDNPMYVSPEIKKEAKIVTFTPSGKDPRKQNQTPNNKSSKNSTWYVNNPIYNSPAKHGNKASVASLHTLQCQRENNKNIAKSSNSTNNVAKPFEKTWFRSNPCYNSPQLNKLNSPKRSPLRQISNFKRPLPTPKELTARIEVPYANSLDADYLTPLNYKGRFITSMTSEFKNSTEDIKDFDKFLDHEYCTIPGDNDSSWTSKNLSPVAKRSLRFCDYNQDPEAKTENGCSAKKRLKKPSPVTPSRIWRETAKIQQSTPCKKSHTYKNIDSIKPNISRTHRTPRAVKRETRRRNANKLQLPPDLPKNPAPALPKKEQCNPVNNPIIVNIEEDNPIFQLPPDSIYESLSSYPCYSPPAKRKTKIASHVNLGNKKCPSVTKLKDLRAQKPARRTKNRSQLDQSVRSERRSSYCPDTSNRGHRSRGKRTAITITPKYRPRDVLQGKGQLKLAVYENFGLLTIHVMEAKKLRSRYSLICNPYVKISLVPDTCERTFCRTLLVKGTNAPIFDQKFSFDFLPEDLDKRLLISLWNRDMLRKKSEFLGCMSFSVGHITNKRITGWFRLLTEAVGRRKHFAVSFLNTTADISRKIEDRSSSDEIRKQDILVENKKIFVDEQRRQIITQPMIPRPCNTKQNMEQLRDYREVVKTCNIDEKLNPVGQTPYTITVSICQDIHGFGFSVSWTKPPRVERVELGRAADRAGLRPGDYIIFVGQRNIVKLDENEILASIRESGSLLVLEVYRQGVSLAPQMLTSPWPQPYIPSIQDSSSTYFHRQESIRAKNPINVAPFSHREVGYGILI